MREFMNITKALADENRVRTLLAVRELAGGRFAVLRFSGGGNAQHEAETLARLQTWLAAQGLKASETPVSGYFDPPWTPSFLRRNEVMLRVETGQ